MNISFDLIEDKVEFFEATSLKDLEKQIQTQIDLNKSILLCVHSVSHQMYVSEDGRRLYSAVVHFKNKKA
ncbi:YrzA family protein [Bacillus sp. JJ722]|uniref:YrzA family protein n=1 Tax=Bacillus sp. JJ722 TaxID=3122973 RepID=UPI002FFF1912